MKKWIAYQQLCAHGIRAMFEKIRAANGWLKQPKVLTMRSSEQRGEFKQLEKALATYDSKIKILSRKKDRSKWAETQVSRAIALQSLGEREGETQRLEQALAGYDAALTVRSLEAKPIEWARTQYNRGTVLQILGEREGGTGRLKEALAAYEAALTIRTLKTDLAGWIRARMNQGIVLQILGERENSRQRYEHAAQTFDALLAVLTSKGDWAMWAQAQMNRGVVLARLGEREGGTKWLEEALVAYASALRVFTFEAAPVEWAQTQMNRGTLLTILGERVGGTQYLEEALATFNAVLPVFGTKNYRIMWAQAHMNRAVVLKIIGEREIGTLRLEEALESIDAALTVLTPESDLTGWATTQSSRGNLLMSLGEREADTQRLKQAVEAFDAVLAVRTLDANRVGWAITQTNRGRALLELGTRENSTQCFEMALAAYDTALTVIDLEANRTGWATTQINRASVLVRLGDQERDTRRLEKALAGFDAALTALNSKSDPTAWALAQLHRGSVLMRLGEHGPDVLRLEEAVVAYQNGLAHGAALRGGKHLLAPSVALAHTFARLERWEEAVSACEAAFDLFHGHFMEAETPFQREELLRMISGLGPLAALAGVRSSKPSAGLHLLERGRAVQLHEALALDEARLARVEYKHAVAIRDARARIRRLRDILIPSFDGDSKTVRPVTDVLADLRQAQTELSVALEAAGLDPPQAPSLAGLLALMQKSAALIVPVTTKQGSFAFVIPANTMELDEHHVVPLDLDTDLLRQALLKWLEPYRAYTESLEILTQIHTAVAQLHTRIEKLRKRQMRSTSDWMINRIFAAMERIESALLSAETSAAEAKSAAQRSGHAAEVALSDLLVWLGARVMGPVLERLSVLGVAPARANGTGGALESLAPELILMPVGDFALMPLQAALCSGLGPLGEIGPVLEGYAVSLTPSLGAWRQARAKPLSQQALSLCALLNPDHKPDPQGNRRRGNLVYSEMIEGPGLARIFAECAGPKTTHMLFGPAADRAGLIAVLASRTATHLHIASHGFYDWSNPANSGLILAGEEPLRVRDLAAGSLQLEGCRLAVLSACETGISDVTHIPDEAAGLVAGFLAAGVRGVVATLWAVADDSTALFMMRFYAILLDGTNGSMGEHLKPSPAQAVRLASLWLRSLSATQFAREIAELKIRSSAIQMIHGSINVRPKSDGLVPIDPIDTAATCTGADIAGLGFDLEADVRLTLGVEKPDAIMPTSGSNPNPITFNPLRWAPFTVWGA